VQSTNSEPASGRRMAKLFQLGDANYHCFTILAVFMASESACMLRTARAGQGICTEHEEQTWLVYRMVKLLWLGGANLRRFPPSGPFSRLVRARVTRKRLELDEECVQNTNSNMGSVFPMVKLLPLGGATFRLFSVPVRFRDSKRRL
jgi:hypothetical protein